MGKLNKKQYIITALLFIATLLYNFNNAGNSKPLFNPINILVYCLAAAILIIALGIFSKLNCCPKCGTKLPKIRLPKNINEALFGWTTCPKCKAQIDNNRQIVNGGQ